MRRISCLTIYTFRNELHIVHLHFTSLNGNEKLCKNINTSFMQESYVDLILNISLKMPTTSRRKRIGRRPKCRHQVRTTQAHTGKTLDLSLGNIELDLDSETRPTQAHTGLTLDHSYVDIETDWDSETDTESEHVNSIEDPAVDGDIVTQTALNTGNVEELK